jgi:hypothetical protein
MGACCLYHQNDSPVMDVEGDCQHLRSQDLSEYDPNLSFRKAVFPVPEIEILELYKVRHFQKISPYAD